MIPIVNKTRKTSHGDKRNRVAKAAPRPFGRSLTKLEHARTLATAAASGPKRPTHGQMPKAVAVDFSALLGELRQTAGHAFRRPRQGFQVGLPEAVSRKGDHLIGAASQ